MAKKYIDADVFIGWARTRYCKDCDKRKGMKNGKMRFCYDIGDAPCRACDVDDMVEDVDNFPAADVKEVKHGAWEMIPPPKVYEKGAYVKFRCSECGVEYKSSSRYCRNCGARMDGKKGE